MKNSKTVRITTVILIIVLIAALAGVGATLAKYITETIGNTTVDISHFGVEIISKDFSAFSNEYTSTPGDDNITVSATKKVIAPGTRADITDFTIKGTASVSVRVSYEAEITLTDWTVDNYNDYCPLIFTVNGNDYKITNDGEIKTIEQLENAVEKAIGEVGKDYKYEEEVKDVLSVSWRWEHEVDNNNSYQNDRGDTALGNAELNGNKIPTISIEIKAKVDQILPKEA